MSTPENPAPEQQQPAPEPPSSEGWTPPTREQFEELAQQFMMQREQLAAASALLQNQQQQPQQQEEPWANEPEPPGSELFDPENLKRYVAQQVQEQVNQGVNQHPLVQQMYEGRGNMIAREQLFPSWEEQLGKFDHEIAIHTAQSIANANPGIPPEQALWYGANEAKRMGDQLRSRAISEYEEQLKNRLDAPKEVPSAPPAEYTPHQTKSYDEATKNFFARRNAQISPN